MIQAIPLKNLLPDPRNANVCDEKTMAALRENIQRTGFCPVLTVRPGPKKGQFTIMDGHHRKKTVESLGWETVECQMVDLNDDEAKIALLTLNRLRGTDQPHKRAELIQSLLPKFSTVQLAALLPEGEGEIKDLLKLLQQDTQKMEQALRENIAKEQATLPIPMGFLLQPNDHALVKSVLLTFSDNLSQALVLACQKLQVVEVNNGN